MLRKMLLTRKVEIAYLAAYAAFSIMVIAVESTIYGGISSDSSISLGSALVEDLETNLPFCKTFKANLSKSESIEMLRGALNSSWSTI